MSTVKCEICNKSGESFFIVTHKELGRIRICSDCLKREAKNLLAQKSCGCC
jgi:ribosome-binding protein aMBF1 (putative translation factor)